MQPATAETVLGDFDDASMTHFGDVSRFMRREDGFAARVTGADGKPREYEIRHTFGVTPLQQYLVETERGRLQTLPTCWDTRSAAEGGQRWFHVYPEEPIPHTDELHWTGPLQNWNYMCAECHSTGLLRNYDAETDSYATTWSEIDVSCEACHGPGSRHVEWAEAMERGERPATDDMGLVTRLKQPAATWIIDPKTGNARRDPPLASRAQLDACAPCHARRGVLGDGRDHASPFLDSYLPSLLEENLYHDDGQILDEVYVYGSFLQSRMHAQGVRCSDCHEPHSATLLAEGNALCSQCHDRERYDVPAHHHHPVGSSGAQCVECHMPSRTYMVVDPRRDHSFRVPRPDLSVSLGTPNACTACHEDRDDAWAASTVKDWYGEGRRREAHWGEAIHAARAGEPDAPAALDRWVRDPDAPGIARATALAELRWFGGTVAAESAAAGARDEDPLVRIGALRALESLPTAARMEIAAHLLEDPLRAVRTEAARVLAGSRPDSRAVSASMALALDEFVESQRASSEMTSSALNLGLLYTNLGRHEDAEREYRRGIRLDPREVACYVNLADLYRLLGRDTEGEAVLRDALRQSPDNPEALHSLGLLLARTRRYEAALQPLASAARLRPENPRMAYVYGIALESNGNADRAIAVFEEGLARHPGNLDLLEALVTTLAGRGAFDEALRHARRLVELAPDSQQAADLLRSLQARAAGSGN